MDFIKKWALCLLVISIVTSIFKMLIPDGNIKRCADAAFSLVVILVIISPMFEGEKLKLNIDTDFFENVTYDSNSVLYKNAITQSVEKVLEENEILYNSVDVDMNINEDGYIVINSIVIDTVEQADEEQLKSSIAEKTEFEAEIITVR